MEDFCSLVVCVRGFVERYKVLSLLYTSWYCPLKDVMEFLGALIKGIGSHHLGFCFIDHEISLWFPVVCVERYGSRVHSVVK